ncbi:MAG TPA: UGSC family (seleno)protein [Solirubrobacteraceae bacterium]|nr:UGSC family (seleno)protein [Solirubrobacteraceae bacterium]
MTSAILDPTGLSGKTTSLGFDLAPRRGDLSGVTVGLLENGKQNASLFLQEVADILRERYGAGEARMRRKENFAAPAPPELIDALSAEADLMVIGVGDCGSCSASAVVDGVLFERHGTPSAVICSDAFKATADAMADVQGAPGYGYVTTPHPVAGLTPAQVRERAEAVAAEVAGLLGAGGGARGVA